MPHGLPDWGLEGPKLTTYGLDDLGEHVVRLGSPHLWDRRGDAIWLTDFRDGIDGIQWYLDAGAPVNTLFAGNSRQGAFCIFLEGGGEEGDGYVGIEKILPCPANSRIGLEFSHSICPSAAYVVCEIQIDNPDASHVGRLRYDVANWLLEYEDATGNWVDTEIVPSASHSTKIEHTTKLVIDFGVLDAAGNRAPEYVRAVFNDTLYTFLPGVLLGPLAPAAKELTVRIWMENQDLVVADLYLDNVIVTQNEP